MGSNHKSPGATLIQKYFPSLSAKQLEQFSELKGLYQYWNERINVISRKDIDNLYVHHVLHSLSIARWITFAPGTRIIDLGSGGGFPAIPLAIMFPESAFTCVDSIGKKLKVVNAVSSSIELSNVNTIHSRIEDIDHKVDFIVCRAVANLERLLTWTRGKFLKTSQNAVRNGLIALKGGTIEQELNGIPSKKSIEVTDISEYFDEAYFDQKFIIYCPA